MEVAYQPKQWLAARFSRSPDSEILAAISAGYTINHVAKTLGEDEGWLYDLPIDIFREDGCL